MSKDENLDHVEELTAHIVPRKQHAPSLSIPRGSELAWGSVLQGDPTKVVVMCVTCKKALYVVYTDMEKRPISCGDWRVPQRGDEPCPECGCNFARFNEKTKGFQYLTSNGLI